MLWACGTCMGLSTHIERPWLRVLKNPISMRQFFWSYITMAKNMIAIFNSNYLLKLSGITFSAMSLFSECKKRLDIYNNQAFN